MTRTRRRWIAACVVVAAATIAFLLREHVAWRSVDKTVIAVFDLHERVIDFSYQGTEAEHVRASRWVFADMLGWLGIKL